MILEKRVAVITGSGRGIGRAIALRFAKEGARLVLTARTQGQIEETCSQVTALGAEAMGVTGDVSKKADIEKVAANIDAAIAGIQRDIAAIAGIVAKLSRCLADDLFQK